LLRSLQEIQPDFVEEAKALSWAVESRKEEDGQNSFIARTPLVIYHCIRLSSIGQIRNETIPMPLLSGGSKRWEIETIAMAHKIVLLRLKITAITPAGLDFRVVFWLLLIPTFYVHPFER
jgi:hypothetical protein